MSDKPELTANGQVLTISCGHYEAQILTVGAALASLSHDGYQLVVPQNPAMLSKGMQGKVLAPWPNRINQGSYRYGDVRHQLPVNDGDNQAAAHGLVAWVNWQVAEYSEHQVTLETLVFPQPGYPHQLHLTATYRLSADGGLRSKVSVRNMGTDTAPAGIGVHPYLTCDLAKIDECQLRMEAGQMLVTDGNKVPVRMIDVTEANADFRSSTPIGAREIDNAFADLASCPWHLELQSPADGKVVQMTGDTPWLQLYTAEHLGRRGLAVEPMTCPPDAFNSGVDLVDLEPGQETALRYSIRKFDKYSRPA